MTDEFEFSEEEYLSVLELAYEVAQSMEGKVVDDGRKPDCQHLALKLYAHAATSHWLYQGTVAPVPKSTGGTSFVDFASIAVVARAAIETYLTFFEVFVQPENDDEFEFNYCLWHLSGNAFLEGLGTIDPSLHEQQQAAADEISSLRDRLRATRKFKSLKSGQQAAVLKGKRQRDWQAVSKAAGFSADFLHDRIYPYYSGFVHADGLTAGQMMSALTRKDQQWQARMHLVTLMMLLAKFVLNYEDLFAEARAVIPRFTASQKRVEEWAEIAGLLA